MLGTTELLIVVFVVGLIAVSKHPAYKAMQANMIQAREKARQERAARQKDIVHIPRAAPSAERFQNPWEYGDARPYHAEPIRIVVDQGHKGGSVIGKVIVIALCIAYIVWPLDFIPDFIPVLGYGDDLAAGLIGLKALLK